MKSQWSPKEKSFNILDHDRKQRILVRILVLIMKDERSVLAVCCNHGFGCLVVCCKNILEIFKEKGDFYEHIINVFHNHWLFYKRYSWGWCSLEHFFRLFFRPRRLIRTVCGRSSYHVQSNVPRFDEARPTHLWRFGPVVCMLQQNSQEKKLQLGDYQELRCFCRKDWNSTCQWCPVCEFM